MLHQRSPFKESQLCSPLHSEEARFEDEQLEDFQDINDRLPENINFMLQEAQKGSSFVSLWYPRTLARVEDRRVLWLI